MATTKEKFSLLVDRLYEKTSEGLLDWNIGESNFIGYVTDIGSISVYVFKSENDFGEPVVTINLIKDGRIVDKFDDEYFKNIAPGNKLFDTFYSYMSELYEMAHRKATNADAALDEALGTLALI